MTEEFKLHDSFAERPDDWMGGDGEAANTSSWLQSGPPRKARASWIGGVKDEEETQAEDVKVGMSETERKSANAMVMQKLTALSSQKEGIVSDNERAQSKSTDASIAEESRASTGTTQSADSTVEEHPHHTEQVSLQREDVAYMTERPGDWLGGDTLSDEYLHSPTTKPKTKAIAAGQRPVVDVQRHDFNPHILDRPDEWMGGEREAALTNSYLQCPKAKKRTSWLKNSNEDSQSLRDLTAPQSPNKKHDVDNLNASDHLSYSSPTRVQRNSALVKKKLAEAKQKNEQSQKKDDELAAPSSKKEEAIVKGARPAVDVQRHDFNPHILDRPDEWMGGEGETALTNSYLQCPKAKKRTSWLKSGTEESQSLRNLTAEDPDAKKHDLIKLNASASHLSHSSPKGRRSSALVMQKLAELNKHNEDNHKKNEELEVKPLPPPKVFVPKASGKPSTKDGGQSKDSVRKQPVAEKLPAQSTKIMEEEEPVEEVIAEGARQVVDIQRHDFNPHILDRPDEWLGRDGEADSYLQCPKSKKRTSWLKAGTEESQSLRDLTAQSPNKKHDVDNLNASDHLSYSSPTRVQRNSELVKQKLAALNKQNEENHKKNEKLEVKPIPLPTASKNAAGKGPPSKDDGQSEDAVSKQPITEKPPAPSTKSTEKEVVSRPVVDVQRHDYDPHLLDRPDEWLGGGGEEAKSYSYLQKPKAKLRASWLPQEFDGSKSLSNLGGPGLDDHADELAVSEPQYCSSSRRRQTCPPKAKVGVYSVQETESPAGAAKEKITLQRMDHHDIAQRPDDWLFGASPNSSPKRSPRKKVITDLVPEQSS